MTQAPSTRQTPDDNAAKYLAANSAGPSKETVARALASIYDTLTWEMNAKGLLRQSDVVPGGDSSRPARMRDLTEAERGLDSLANEKSTGLSDDERQRFKSKFEADRRQAGEGFDGRLLEAAYSTLRGLIPVLDPRQVEAIKMAGVQLRKAVFKAALVDWKSGGRSADDTQKVAEFAVENHRQIAMEVAMIKSRDADSVLGAAGPTEKMPLSEAATVLAAASLSKELAPAAPVPGDR